MQELARLFEIPLAVFDSSSVDLVNDNTRDGFPFFDVAAFIIDTNSAKFTKEADFELVGTSKMEITADLLFRLPADHREFDSSGSEALTDEVYEILHRIDGYNSVKILSDRIIYRETGDENLIGWNSTWQFIYVVDNLYTNDEGLRLKWQQVHKKWNDYNQKWNNAGL